MPPSERGPAPVSDLDEPSEEAPAGVIAEPVDGSGGTEPVDGSGGAEPPDGDVPNTGDGPGAGGGAKPPERASTRRWMTEAVVIIVVALLAAVLLRTFVVQTYFIPSGSMEPTLQIGDRILVNKLAYKLHGIGRGDIVVFARPTAEDCGGVPVNDLVKRVIGLPGETVSASNGRVEINGKVLDEPYLPAGTQTNPAPVDEPYSLSQPYTVPSGDYFVMGDNRPDSCDSRYWGPIPKSLIVGKVDVRIWPLKSFRFF